MATATRPGPGAVEPDPDVAQPVVEITALHKAYGATQVLRGVDLSIEAGTLTAVLGRSGSGKTTLLRLLAGFERADRGRIELGGRTVDDVRHCAPPEKRRIGYVPQDGALFPHLTVRGNIGFGLSRPGRRTGRVEELLALTDLSEVGERYPHQLSGGQQQRVALARALAPNPDLILLDEPFSALDAALRASVRADVLAILRAASCTSILVTHDQDEALSMADHIAVLREGRVIQHATARELYESPADPQLARFVGEANLVPAILTPQGADAGALGVLGLRGQRPGDGVATVLIRPEQLIVRKEADEPTGHVHGVGHIPGVIERCEYFGHDMMLTIRLRSTAIGAAQAAGQRLPEMLLARLTTGTPMETGTAVTLAVRGPVTAWAKRD